MNTLQANHGGVGEEDLEIVFALVGPSGCDLGSVIRSLESELRAASYIVPEPVRLAQLLHGLNSNQGLESISDEKERITKHMDAGDALRKKLKVGGVMAALAISVIKEIRKDYPESRRVAYILRSLKHPGEVELLREVYGPALYVLSVYEDKKSRVRRLAQRLQKKAMFQRVRWTLLVKSLSVTRPAATRGNLDKACRRLSHSRISLYRRVQECMRRYVGLCGCCFATPPNSTLLFHLSLTQAHRSRFQRAHSALPKRPRPPRRRSPRTARLEFLSTMLFGDAKASMDGILAALGDLPIKNGKKTAKV